ncbi:MAG: hypothetical protein KDK91_01045 [Gammaproteobacteria bacterium]|nr:hypothetical protein [Gammaproteobacteria bacterium]
MQLVHGLLPMSRRGRHELLPAAFEDGVGSNPSDSEPDPRRAPVGNGRWLIGTLCLPDGAFVVGDLGAYLVGAAADPNWQRGSLLLVRRHGFLIGLRVDATAGPFLETRRAPSLYEGAHGESGGPAEGPPLVPDLARVLDEPELLMGRDRALEKRFR